MKVKTLWKEAQREHQEEKEKFVKKILKKRFLEIEAAEKTLAILKEQYDKLLEKDIDTVVSSCEG